MANDLQDFKLDDLYESIALPDQDFKQFMASQGLLHGSGFFWKSAKYRVSQKFGAYVYFINFIDIFTQILLKT
jgi:hypothetical protein